MDTDIQFLGMRFTSKIPQHQGRNQQRVIRNPHQDVIEVFDSDDDFAAFWAGPSQPHNRVDARATSLPLPHRHDRDGPSDFSQTRNDLAEGSFDATGPSVPSSRSDFAMPDGGEPPQQLYVAQVLEIVPDVLPTYVLELVRRHLDDYKGNVVERILNILFENADYPKADTKGKGKRKRDDEDDEDDVGPSRSRTKIDYASKDRDAPPGRRYIERSLEQLGLDFPSIPLNHIKRMFAREGSFYVPTYLALDTERKSNNLPYRPNAFGRTDKGKGKGKALPRYRERHDEDFERELQWLVEKLDAESVERDAALAEQLNKEEYETNGDGIECGCCFSTYAFDKMVQCPEAHLFCRDCMCKYAETLLGSHDANIVCMDQSGCKAPFPESELRRFLSEKLLALYDRVKQRKEIAAAGLENLEECPHCDYKVVIDNPEEKLFRCENSDCGAVTCRVCKKPDHLPKSCQEADEDKKLDGRHAVEEAMTQALMRNCPKCGRGFVKESGCNKMRCSHCQATSCYVCRKVINGYEHFDQAPPYQNHRNTGKCPLWDSVEKRHADEVAAAAQKAKEDYRRDHPEADERDLAVEVPAAPAAPQQNAPHNRAYAHNHRAQIVAHHHYPRPPHHPIPMPQFAPPPPPPFFPPPMRMVHAAPGIQVGVAQGPGYMPQPQVQAQVQAMQPQQPAQPDLFDQRHVQALQQALNAIQAPPMIDYNFEPRHMPVLPAARQPVGLPPLPQPPRAEPVVRQPQRRPPSRRRRR